MNSPVVHRALVTEVPALAGTLQAAFDDYAWTDWVFPADNRTARLRASFARTSQHRSTGSVDHPGPQVCRNVARTRTGNAVR